MPVFFILLYVYVYSENSFDFAGAPKHKIFHQIKNPALFIQDTVSVNVDFDIIFRFDEADDYSKKSPLPPKFTPQPFYNPSLEEEWYDMEEGAKFIERLDKMKGWDGLLPDFSININEAREVLMDQGYQYTPMDPQRLAINKPEKTNQIKMVFLLYRRAL